MVRNLQQFQKMSLSRFSNLFGRVAVLREEHSRNALLPIVVTLFGIVMDVNLEHPSNALFPIVVTLFGIVMEVKEEHL